MQVRIQLLSISMHTTVIVSRLASSTIRAGTNDCFQIFWGILSKNWDVSLSWLLGIMNWQILKYHCVSSGNYPNHDCRDFTEIMKLGNLHKICREKNLLKIKCSRPSHASWHKGSCWHKSKEDGCSPPTLTGWEGYLLCSSAPLHQSEVGRRMTNNPLSQSARGGTIQQAPLSTNQWWGWCH